MRPLGLEAADDFKEDAPWDGEEATFPACMIPDGGDPCPQYIREHERARELERELARVRKVAAGWHDKFLTLERATHWVAVAGKCIDSLHADYKVAGFALDSDEEIGRISESSEYPSFRIKVGHIRMLADARARTALPDPHAEMFAALQAEADAYQSPAPPADTEGGE